jgi:beta-N-acetylhexosaminidase
MRQAFGQLTLIGISGPALTEEEKKFIVDNNISGVTLFARNCVDPKQVRDLCAELQSLRHRMADKAPLFIGIDMEGGRVARLKSPFTQWPPLKRIGDLDSPTVSFHFTETMGKELKAVGINLDYAPCIDVFTNPKNTVIGDRAISTDPEMVAKHSSALIRGYLKAEVIPCVKHFPGHGHTIIDSHDDLPVEEADLKRLNEVELIPFKKSFRARVELIMTAHILFKNVDAEWPVTLSEKFLKTLLRDELKYRGLIITDDLDMKALAKNYDQAMLPVRSLQAGADLLLYCNEPQSPPRALDSLEKALADGQLHATHIEGIRKRVLAMKKENIPHPDPLDMASAAKLIGHPDHLKLSQAIAQGQVPEGLLATTHA